MTTAQLTNSKSLLALQDFTGEDQQNFLEEVGTLVFQSALMQYLTSVSEEESQIFESFVDKHAESEEFIDNLCKQYPDFEATLTSEMSAFIEEANSLTV